MSLLSITPPPTTHCTSSSGAPGIRELGRRSLSDVTLYRDAFLFSVAFLGAVVPLFFELLIPRRVLSALLFLGFFPQ